MSTARKSFGANNGGSEWKRIAPYALLALASFLCGVALLSVMLWDAERLIKLQLLYNIYYVILLPLALCAAVFLFGVLRSYASFRGKHFGGAIELGGPIVASALVVVGGFWLVPSVVAFPVTVYVHGVRGTNDVVLRNSGSVVVDLGPDRRSEKIGDKGAAYFPAIPANFRARPVRVWVDSEQYESVDADRELSLSSGVLYLAVRKRSGRISGRVQDPRGNPIENADISVLNNSVRTNAVGYFEMTIPGDHLRDKLDLNVRAKGYSSKWYDVTPDANSAVIVLERVD